MVSSSSSSEIFERLKKDVPKEGDLCALVRQLRHRFGDLTMELRNGQKHYSCRFAFKVPLEEAIRRFALDPDLEDILAAREVEAPEAWIVTHDPSNLSEINMGQDDTALVAAGNCAP